MSGDQLQGFGIKLGPAINIRNTIEQFRSSGSSTTTVPTVTGAVTVTIVYKNSKNIFADLDPSMHIETLKSRILDDLRLCAPTSFVMLSKANSPSMQLDPSLTIAATSLHDTEVIAEILVAGYNPQLSKKKLLEKMQSEPYSSWGEARGIPVEVKAARGEGARKGKWKDAFGQDICAISNFVSVRWFKGEWQPGFFIMGITDKGVFEGFTYDEADDLMQATQSAIQNSLSPIDQVRLAVRNVQNVFIVLAEISPSTRMCTWRAKRYDLMGDGSRENSEVDYRFPYPADMSAAQSATFPLNPSLIIGYSELTREGMASLSAEQYLKSTGLKDTIAARVLFGDIKARVAFYGLNGFVVSSSEKPGLVSLFSGDIIDRIRTWNQMVPAVSYNGLQQYMHLPYPVQALREALVNAVAHGLYANLRSDRDYLLVHVHPNCVIIRNRCSSAAEPYSQLWFSSMSAPANPFLMNTLRKCRDDQGMPMFAEAFGMGKRLIISSCVMRGELAPTISVQSVTGQEDDYWWELRLENKFRMHPHVLTIIRRLFNIGKLPNTPSVETDKAAMAAALLSWIGETRANILKRVTGIYADGMKEILQSSVSPVIEIDNKLAIAPWVEKACAGPLWIKANELVEENMNLVSQIYEQLMAEQNRKPEEKAQEVCSSF